jgi:hypothetical protein
MSSAYKMISVPLAQKTVLDNTWVLPSESVPLMEALGRTLAMPVVARDSLPPFPASIKVGLEGEGRATVLERWFPLLSWLHPSLQALIRRLRYGSFSAL